MERLLLMLIQLVIQILFGAIKLALMLATLIGRLLAMILPLVFRALVALVTGVVRLLRARGRANPRSSHPWGVPPRPSAPVPRRGGSKPALTYRRRNTVDNFWRSGDR
jgi:hypothetical protein